MSIASMSSVLNVPKSIFQSLRRTRTRRITRLFATRPKLVRVELVGQDHPALSRVGTLVFYGPLLVVGYAFILASLVWLLAMGIGWAGALFLMGLGHVTLGAWGVRRAGLLGATEDQEVLDFECEPRGAVSEPASRAVSIRVASRK